MDLSNSRTSEQSTSRLATGLILLGAAVAAASHTSESWGVSTSLSAPDADRLAAVNARIRSVRKKFIDAELRGVRVDPVPRFFNDLRAEQESLVAKAERAERRPGRYAARVRYTGVGLMAAGVFVFAVSRFRARAAGLDGDGATQNGR